VFDGNQHPRCNQAGCHQCRQTRQVGIAPGKEASIIPASSCQLHNGKTAPASPAQTALRMPLLWSSRPQGPHKYRTTAGQEQVSNQKKAQSPNSPAERSNHHSDIKRQDYQRAEAKTVRFSVTASEAKAFCNVSTEECHQAFHGTPTNLNTRSLSVSEKTNRGCPISMPLMQQRCQPANYRRHQIWS